MAKNSRILCVSLNSSIDRRIRVPRLNTGEVNRAISAEPEAGGKAAHVAFAARALSADVRWLGLLGGPEGEGCREGLQTRGITAVCVPIAGRTRTNLEIIDEATGDITEVLEPGPAITPRELQSFVERFAGEVNASAIVVLSGSLPRETPTSIYADLIVCAKNAGCDVLMDTSGEALSCSLDAGPSLVKPNRSEAEAILGRKIENIDDATIAAGRLKALGPDEVIISLGMHGAIAACDRAVHAVPPQVSVLSAVGSGDSMLAGWAVARLQGRSFEDRLRFAVACGAANCVASSPGIISAETVQQFLPLVKLQPCSA